MKRPPCVRTPGAPRLTSCRLFHTLGRTLDERRPTHAIVQPPRRPPQSTTMSGPPVTYRSADGVAWITLDRPAVLNALDTALAATLADHAQAAAADPDVYAVVVAGGGRAFCPGMGRTALAA